MCKFLITKHYDIIKMYFFQRELYFPVFFLGETLVNVLDFKKDSGLWHGVLTVSITDYLHFVSSFQFYRLPAWLTRFSYRVSWTGSTLLVCHTLSWRLVRCPGCREFMFTKVKTSSTSVHLIVSAIWLMVSHLERNHGKISTVLCYSI